MKKKLSEIQAFNAMRLFLEKYYEMTSSEDIGALLSGMQFVPDDTTVDPAIWYDWENAVIKILEEPGDTKEYLKLKK